MATTCGQGTRKADSGPGARKGGGAEKKSAIVEKEETQHSGHQPTASLEQPQKGRGRPRKVTVVDVPTVHEDQDPAPIEDPPRKRVRNNAKPANEVDNQPAAKRLKANNAGVPQVPCQQRKAGDTQKVAIVPPRDPLPDCTGRNVHPGPKKATRRSHQEVEAERGAKAKAIEEQIQELETANRLLAEANAFEDIENDATDQNPQRLSTVIQKRERVDVVGVVGDSDDGELLDSENVDELIDTSEDEEPVKQKVVSVDLRQKAQKTPTDWKHV
jgi:hypothetical protein